MPAPAGSEPDTRAEWVVSGALSAAAAGLAVLALGWWLSHDPAARLTTRVPLEQHPEAGPAATTIGAFFASHGGVAADLPGSWPRFRGASFDNVNADGTPLAESWGPTGPPVLWSLDLGEGHAGAAVHRGRVYVLDYLEEVESDALRCFSLADGREIWRRWYPTGAKRNHGISRTVPAVTDDWVVTVGPRCHVMCLDAVSGELLWGIDLVREFGTEEPLWYTAQCPLIDDGLAIIAPGGDALMIAVDCASGEVVWKTPNPRGWKMSHASVVPMEIGGRRTYVYPALGGLVGVAADGPDAGTVLWETAEWRPSVAAPSPVYLGDGRIFVTAGYGAGSALFQVSQGPGGYAVERVYELDRRVFGCEQQTPVFYGGRLYGVLPKDGGALREQLVCLDPAGEALWSSGRERRFGLGPFMVAGDKLLLLDDDGTLTMARADAREYRELARVKVLDGRDAWAPLALVGGRLLLRDSKRMVCLDLRAVGPAEG